MFAARVIYVHCYIDAFIRFKLMTIQIYLYLSLSLIKEEEALDFLLHNNSSRLYLAGHGCLLSDKD